MAVISSQQAYSVGLGGVYTKALFASTEVDTMTSSLYKPILNGGTIGNLSFDAKYIAAGPISEPIRPLYGVLWPKGHK